jgi:hypothetical protein
VKRLNRPSGAFSRLLPALLALACSCGAPIADRGEGIHGGVACDSLDSMLGRMFPATPWSMEGRATFDVDDYRVRGRFRLWVASRDRLGFEFEGTTLFGGHHEDVVVSVSGDTLRIFDRERGSFYEGAQVDDLVWRGTHARGDWVAAVREVAGLEPGCDDRSELRDEVDHVSGLVRGGAFVLTLDGRRVDRASWPDPTRSETHADRLEVRYDWSDGALREVTIALANRGWRIRLTAS